MTKQLDDFIEENHYLVEQYLRMKGLNVDDFYDVVIFRFMEAASEYLSKPQLRQKYDFKIIAFAEMKKALKDHYRKQNRLKRRGITVELTDAIQLPAYGYSGEPYTDDMRIIHLLHEMEQRLSRPQMSIINMRVYGYSVREIASEKKLTMRYIEELLSSARPVIEEICMQGVI